MKIIRGNTMRFEAEFRNWDNNNSLIDPSVVKLIIYDIQFKKLQEIILNDQNHMSQGKFFYLYIPQEVGHFYYEWNGDIDGLPSLIRGEFTVREV